MERIAERGSWTDETAGTRTAFGSRKGLWAGRLTSGVVIAFLAFDGVAKVLELAPVMEGTAELGYPKSIVFGLGVVLLACLVVHVVPRTAVLGAILLTGYLGGAVATHARLGHPLPSHTLFPIYVAVLLWGGLYLRDARLRTIVPLRERG